MDNNPLSDREREILQLVSQGKSNKQIAADLFISINTVKVHVSNIYQKIGVSSRTEAMLFMIEQGIVESRPMNLRDIENLTNPNEEPETALSKWQVVQRKYWWFLFIFGFILFGAIVVFIVRFTNNNSAQRFQATLQSNRWQAVGEMSTNRFNHASIVLDSDLFIIGGEDETGIVDLVESFNLNSKALGQHASKPTPVSMTTAVSLGGKIYLPGGKVDSGEGVNVLEVYDPRTNDWTELAELPISVYDSGVVTYEGKIYMFGGINEGKPITDVMRYDPSTDAWTLLTPMPDNRAHPGVLALEDKLYVIGGYNEGGPTDSTIIYSPSLEETDQYEWKRGIEFPIATPIIQGVVIGSTPLILVKDSIWQYLPTEEKWILFDQKSELTKEGQSVAGSDVYLYATGGLNNEGKSTDSIIRFQVVFTLIFPILNE
jgi:DNA-binding CsgD family transcriptional regulator